MKLLPPVVWREGMHLSQHHFQAQSRYFETLASFTLRQVASAPWGLLSVGLDAEALTNGTAVLHQARGILPDGTPFHFPQEPPPPPLPIGEAFSPTRTEHLLLLVLPAYRPERANCSAESHPSGGQDALRYGRATTIRSDETLGGEERPVEVLQGNFRLMLDEQLEAEEGDAEVVTLPVARILRDGSGHFVYDPEFVPPSLALEASPRLQRMVHRLVEILESRARALAEASASNGSPPSGGTAAGAPGEVASLWLRHAIHSALPPLMAFRQGTRSHPRRLFAELSRLAGALCTFSLDAHPRDLPLYDHANPEPGFKALETHIRRHLELNLPSGVVVVPLHAARAQRDGRDESLVPAEAGQDTSFFLGSVRDTRAFGKAEWYLGIHTALEGPRVAAHAPEVVKICSARFVARLVREALPGIGLEPVASPPQGVRGRPGTVFFRMLRTDPCWTAIVRDQEVGIHLPASLPGAEVTLSVILDD